MQCIMHTISAIAAAATAALDTSLGAAAVHDILVHSLATFGANHRIRYVTRLARKDQAVAVVVGVVPAEVLVHHRHKFVGVVHLVGPLRVPLDHWEHLLTDPHSDLIIAPAEDSPPFLTAVERQQIEDAFHDDVIVDGAANLLLRVPHAG